MSLFLAHSGQMMSSLSVMNPLPTMDTLHEEHTKQSLCQCRPSKDMKRVPPMPENSKNDFLVANEKQKTQPMPLLIYLHSLYRMGYGNDSGKPNFKN